MDARQVAIIALASLAWVLSFGVFILRICQRFPGIRTLCRYIFLGELAVAFALGIAGSLVIGLLSQAVVLTLLKVAFGIGILIHATMWGMFLHWLRSRDRFPLKLPTEGELLELLSALREVPRAASRAI